MHSWSFFKIFGQCWQIWLFSFYVYFRNVKSFEFLPRFFLKTSLEFLFPNSKQVLKKHVESHEMLKICESLTCLIVGCLHHGWIVILHGSVSNHLCVHTYFPWEIKLSDQGWMNSLLSVIAQKTILLEPTFNVFRSSEPSQLSTVPLNNPFFFFFLFVFFFLLRTNFI